MSRAGIGIWALKLVATAGMAEEHTAGVCGDVQAERGFRSDLLRLPYLSAYVDRKTHTPLKAGCFSWRRTADGRNLQLPEASRLLAETANFGGIISRGRAFYVLSP